MSQRNVQNMRSSTGTAARPKSGFWFVRVDIAVLRDSSLSPCEKALYAVICTHADVKTRTAMLSIATIARETNCSERTAQKCVKKLVGRGVLERKERFVERRQVACLYHIVGGNALRYEDTGADSATKNTETVENCTLEGAESADKLEPVVNENQKNNPFPPTPQSGEEGEDVKKPSRSENPVYDTAEQKKSANLVFCGKVQKLYGEILPDLNPATLLTPKHIREIEARIREDPAREEIDWWKHYFQSIREFPCAMGMTGSDWSADFDWLIGKKGTRTVLGGAFIPASNTQSGSKHVDGGWEKQKQYTDEEGVVDARALLRER